MDTVSLSLLRIIIISGSSSGFSLIKVKSVMSGSGMSLSLLASSGGSSLEEGMGCLVRDSSGSNSVVSSC